MKKIYIILFLLLAAVLNKKLAAQDSHFSQFQYNPLNLGPAESGTMDGDLRISALHRRQWNSVTVPYQTFSLGADAKLNALSERLERFGAGLIINQDKAGDGILQTLQVSLSFSYSIPLSVDSVHFLILGMNGGFVQKNLDQNRLSFDNQYNGDNFIPQSPTGESFDRTNYSYADAGAGIAWISKFEKTTYRAGLQFQHLNRADLSYYSSHVVRLPVLSQIHIQADHALSEKIILMPAVNFMRQNKFTELNFGMEAKVILKNEPAKKYALSAGIFYRSQDAIIPMIGVYYNKFRFGFSYDINLSSLHVASNYRGGPEITLIYLAKKIKSNSQKRIICPLY